MLAELRIEGMGVIESAGVELDPGLTVLTGETGAGKTMVVTGLQLISGARADGTRVRGGARRASVEGRFELDHAQAGDVLHAARDAGAEADEDGSLIAVRSVTSQGRSRAYLGGRSVPNGVLGGVAEGLLAVHGQNEQLKLLQPERQRELLDRFGGEQVGEPLQRYRQLREQWQHVSQELRRRTEHAREMAREADLLRHGIFEIEQVAPQPDEDGELVTEAKRLTDADHLRGAATAAQEALSGSSEDSGPEGEAGALDALGRARRELDGCEDEQLRQLGPRLQEATTVIADVAGELSSYRDRLEADPQRLERNLARQAELKTLTRKYAADVSSVLEWAEESRRRLGELDTSEEALAQLAQQRDELASALAEQASALRAARQQTAGTLADAVNAELGDLAMPGASVELQVRARSAGPEDAAALSVRGETCHAGAWGTEEVVLQLRGHPGAEPLPVTRAASGGELSRVMLAVEVVLAAVNPVPTLVFDEVDAGIGGKAAMEVGRRLARLAASHQVIVVTHLPQVAAYADRHLVVGKTVGEAAVTSDVEHVTQQQRVAELARMMAGLEAEESGRAHAEDLLATACAHREQDAQNR